MGELRRNAEYHMAKQRQEFVNSRMGPGLKKSAGLSWLLVNMDQYPKDRVALWLQVRVFDKHQGRGK